MKIILIAIICLICTVLGFYYAFFRYLLLKNRCKKKIKATVEQVSIIRSESRRETLLCSYKYGTETYISKVKSPNRKFKLSKGDEISVNINPNNPKEVLILTRLFTVNFVLSSIFMLALMITLCGIAFGGSREPHILIPNGFIWEFYTENFVLSIGRILVGIILVIVCLINLIKLIVEPFVCNITDKKICGILDDIDVRTNDTYEGKTWKNLTYKYEYKNMQYTYNTVTTDEDVKKGNEIILKINTKKPTQAYEPHSTMFFIKLLTIVVLVFCMYVGAYTSIPNLAMASLDMQHMSIYSWSTKDDKVDASPEYISKCNRIKPKEDVIVYLPKEYKAYHSKNNTYGFNGRKKSDVFVLKINETSNSVDETYNQLMEEIKNREYIIGYDRELFYNNNKFLVYEVEKGTNETDRSNCIISVNDKYYMEIIIGWEEGEEDPTEQILSSLKY